MELGGHKTGDAVCVNMLFGPPSDPDDADRMLSGFFAEEGRHIICGGTTATLAAEFLQKPLAVSLRYEEDAIPPVAEIEGVDIVTEGVITVSRVLEYAQDRLGENRLYGYWKAKKDAASQISRLLFEEADEIHLYVGRAVNPAHQAPNLPIGFSVKMHAAEELAGCLEKMGKKIQVNYF